jgi:hypothetical protein
MPMHSSFQLIDINKLRENLSRCYLERNRVAID